MVNIDETVRGSYGWCKRGWKTFCFPSFRWPLFSFGRGVGAEEGSGRSAPSESENEMFKNVRLGIEDLSGPGYILWRPRYPPMQQGELVAAESIARRSFAWLGCPRFIWFLA